VNRTIVTLEAEGGGVGERKEAVEDTKETKREAEPNTESTEVKDEDEGTKPNEQEQT
jgi:hypothetical protein